MAIRKRGKSWQIDYLDPNGKRVRKSFRKRKDAEGELGKRVSLIMENRYLDVKKDYTTTLGQLLDKYTENFKTQISYRKAKRLFIQNFRDYWGSDTRLSNIRYVDLETYRNKLRQKITPRGTLRADASVNREMSCLHHVFQKGVEWDMMERSPFDRGRSLHIKENNERIRYLSEDEVKRLLDECECKPYLYRVVVTALNSGMRKSEILGLKWSRVQNGFIYLDKTKNKKKRQIPVNEDLERVFKDIRKEQGLSSDHVFTNNKKVVKRVDYGFNSAVERAKIEDFHFHDLRHTFASHVIMRGGTLKDVQELLGHKTLAMTLRYAHLSQEHKRNAVNLLNGFTSTVTKTSHPENQVSNLPKL